MSNNITLKLFTAYYHSSESVDWLYDIYIDGHNWSGNQVRTYSSNPNYIQFCASDSVMSILNISHVTGFSSKNEMTKLIKSKLDTVEFHKYLLGNKKFVRIHELQRTTS